MYYLAFVYIHVCVQYYIIYIHFLKELDVQDYGDVLYDANNISDVNNMSHLGYIASCTSRLSEQVRQVLRDGRQALTIGGDHSLSIGTIDGHVKVFNSKYIYI